MKNIAAVLAAIAICGCATNIYHTEFTDECGNVNSTTFIRWSFADDLRLSNPQIHIGTNNLFIMAGTVDQNQSKGTESVVKGIVEGIKEIK